MERVAEAERTGRIHVEEGSVWKIPSAATTSRESVNLHSQLNPTRPKLPDTKEDEQETVIPVKVKPVQLKAEGSGNSVLPRTVPIQAEPRGEEEGRLWKPLPSPTTLKSSSNSNSLSETSNGETEVSSNGLSSGAATEAHFLPSPTSPASSCVSDELGFFTALLDSADRFRQFLVTELTAKFNAFRREPTIAQMLSVSGSYRLSELKHRPKKDNFKSRQRRFPEGFPKLLSTHGKEVENLFMNWLEVHGGETLANLIEDIEISTLKRLLDPHRPCDFDNDYFQVKQRICERYASNVFQTIEWCVTLCRIIFGSEGEVRSCLATQPPRIRKQLTAYRDAVAAASGVVNQFSSAGPHLTRGTLQQIQRAQEELAQTRLSILKKLAKIHGEVGSQATQSTQLASHSSAPITQTPVTEGDGDSSSAPDVEEEVHPQAPQSAQVPVHEIVVGDVISVEREPSSSGSRKRGRSGEIEIESESEVVLTVE
jgi:hypothetical protein